MLFWFKSCTPKKSQTELQAIRSRFFLPTSRRRKSAACRRVQRLAAVRKRRGHHARFMGNFGVTPHGSPIMTRTAQGKLNAPSPQPLAGEETSTERNRNMISPVRGRRRALCARRGVVGAPCGGFVAVRGFVVVFVFFFCGGVLLCVLCLLLFRAFFVLGGVVSLPFGCGCLGSLLVRVLVVFARCRLFVRGGRRLFRVLRRLCLRGGWRSCFFLPRCWLVVASRCRGCGGRGGLVLVLVGLCRLRSLCLSRRCCRRVGVRVCCRCFGRVVGRRGRRRGLLVEAGLFVVGGVLRGVLFFTCGNENRQ